MKQTINNSQFHNAFHSMGRGEQFSYEALDLIYEYMESLEADTGEDYELDVIAICCEFVESTPEELASSYDVYLSECNTDAERLECALDYLNDNTVVVGVTALSIVYIQF